MNTPGLKEEKLYSIVIVDDESIIVDAILKSIPWTRLNCKVVATADNGDEGSEIIRKYKPNMVLCDIIMPKLDGLAMVAGMKSEFEDMEVSVLTGCRDFIYAQRAVELGVTRFLLKPLDVREVEEAIKAMVENLRKKKILSGVFEGQRNAANGFIIKNAINYIDEHYYENLTLVDVAEKMYVSKWHLSRLLNKSIGKSFPDILNDKRIEEAKELLRDSSLRITDVSELVGFLDSAHFSRVFKKIEGISANEYRNNML